MIDLISIEPGHFSVENPDHFSVEINTRGWERAQLRAVVD